MKDAGQFMREYLNARIAVLKNEAEILAPFRRKYYAEDCRRDRREELIAETESEELVQVSVAADSAEAITSVTTRRSVRQRVRYQLKSIQGDWLIQSVAAECKYCRGEEGLDCPCCDGSGWMPGKNSPLPADARFDDNFLARHTRKPPGNRSG